ncbi:MAG: symmetrical bis(5'-nucleosyl)-tetraphosphatase [Myxococcota bacterium]
MMNGATYAVGDVQGCALTLHRLLDAISFRPGVDRLWLVGDLVNRGRHNVEVLRTLRQLQATAVLGNHDLLLLAAAAGFASLGRTDSVQDVLTAPDRHELLEWLRSRPLFHCEGGWAMVHAGFRPDWTTEEIIRRARRAGAAVMQRGILRHWKAAKPSSPSLEILEDLRTFTTIRMVDAAGTPTGFKGPPEEAPSGQIPWFERHGGISSARVVFGHWAALGHRDLGRFVSLDSGAVWGKSLTTLRLDDGRVFRVPTVREDLPSF